MPDLNPNTKWNSSLEYLKNTLVKVSRDGNLTGSSYKIARRRLELPSYQTIFSLANLVEPETDLSSFHDAVRVLTDGEVNSEPPKAPRRGTGKKWTEEELEKAILVFIESEEFKKFGGSSYSYVRWYDNQESGKYPSASTISTRFGQFALAIKQVTDLEGKA